jgi:signal transduction histidine kinase
MVVSIIMIALCLVLAVVSQIVRYRRGDERMRLRIRWLVLSAGVVVISLIASWFAEPYLPAELAYTPFLIATVVLVPISIGIAIVRHDLFDIDRLLSASATWLITLIITAAVFAGIVVAIGAALAPWLGQALAAFASALLLLPLHRHVAALIGRLLDPDRHVAVAAVRRFAAEVRGGARQPEEIEDALRQAQRDPDLTLALAHPDGGWVDIAGRSVDRPDGIEVESGGDVIARISLGWESARARRRIADLARVAWVPIELARSRLLLREALNRLAVAAAEERKRLERDLHDGVQQRLIATGMRLRLLEQELDSAHTAEIDIAVDELEATVTELRSLAHGVRPSRLDDGLGPALEAVRSGSPVPVRLDIGTVPIIDETTIQTAYLVISEAVANALKHARATQITVRVRDEQGCLVVEIHDDGIGGVTAPPPAIRDRVATVGGYLTVTSPDSGGTIIRAVL